MNLKSDTKNSTSASWGGWEWSTRRVGTIAILNQMLGRPSLPYKTQRAASSSTRHGCYFAEFHPADDNWISRRSDTTNKFCPNERNDLLGRQGEAVLKIFGSQTIKGLKAMTLLGDFEGGT